MEQRGETPILPSVPFPHLAKWWLEIGPTQAGGMGEAVIGWQEMAAWERVTGLKLGPWEARAIRSMSSAFVSMRQDARKSGCPAPFAEDPEQIQQRVDAQFAQMMKAFAQKPKSGK